MNDDFGYLDRLYDKVVARQALKDAIAEGSYNDIVMLITAIIEELFGYDICDEFGEHMFEDDEDLPIFQE